jgi:hypothetical protein
MHFQDFGNGFLIFGNAFPKFQFLEMDTQFGDEFQCISLNLSYEFLIKKLYIFTFSLKTHGFSMDFVLNYYLKTLMTKQALDNYKNICGKP